MARKIRYEVYRRQMEEQTENPWVEMPSCIPHSKARLKEDAEVDRAFVTLAVADSSAEYDPEIVEVEEM